DRNRRVLPPDDLQHFESAHTGQLVIGEDEIGPIDQGQRFFGARGFIDIETGIEQLQLDDAAQLIFIFHYQNSLFHGRLLTLSRGRQTRKVLPLPGSLSTVILPPWPLTILETMASPRPTPVCLVVKNGLNIVSILSPAMPEPQSIMSISMPCGLRRVETVIGEPGSDACAALDKRLMNTCSIRAGSMASGGTSGE